MKKLMLILAVAFVGASAWSQSSSSDEDRKKELVGLTGFRVLVSVSPDSFASLLPVSSIQTDVELKLRIARIPVLPEDWSLWLSKANTLLPKESTVEEAIRDTAKAAQGIGTIIVGVDGVRSSIGPIWAVSLRVECIQLAQLTRDQNITSTGLSWVDSYTGIYSETVVAHLREKIKDSIDTFVNLYLSANP